MGGALATLCALDMKLNLGATDVRLYTFGSPRVGNAIFAQWFEEQIAVSWGGGGWGGGGGGGGGPAVEVGGAAVEVSCVDRFHVVRQM